MSVKPYFWASLLLSVAGAVTAGDLPHSHIAGFLGFARESRPGTPDEDGGAAGLAYEYRFHEHWGVGGVAEVLGGDFIRNVTLVVPVSWHPTGNWRFLAGPGYEFTDKKDKFLVRVGAGYEFHLGGNWTLAPECILDYIETDTTVWIARLALGYEF